ncbi:Rib/alpha-like domain-containing protein [Ligilactobacillus animalis]|uniref:Rib/alpha-like domain-containing protein n=1 Tax=Ligilactobacillus animalis TaxID=1605 RepID=UPI002A74C804|nr:Rib/alpha-like domain-containing protein [Ligilactobacillus animalis]MDY2992486.1 Rib/alpha-like domain-containing protein [Ligilactobacillus animalis]
MLSKNNTDLYANKLAPKRQKFAIKKFTVGVASVLVGTTFALYAGTSHVAADQVEPNTAQSTTKDTVEQKGEPKKQPEAVSTNAPVAPETKAPQQVQSATPEKTVPAQTTSPVLEQQPTTPQQQPVQPEVVPSQDASHVSDMAQFQTALNDKNVAEIVLDKDVTNDTDNYVNVDKPGVARDVTVWGSKVDERNTTLNLGDHSLYFYNKTTIPDHKWQLNFKNVNVETNDPHGYGVVSFQNNGTDATVNFDNVKASGNGVLVYAPNATVNLHDVSATPTYVESSPSANVTANNVDLSGNVTLTAGVNNASTPQNVYANGKVNVKSGANVVLTTNNAYSNETQNLTAGALHVEKNAKLNVKVNTTAPNVAVPTGGTWESLVANSRAVDVTNGNAKVDGELTVDPFTKEKRGTSVVAAVVLSAPATTQNDLVIGPTGKLVVNATQAPNTRGVYFVNNNHAFGVQNGGQVLLKMGHGVSNAVWNPDNLVLSDGSKLDVETYQDNNGVTNVGIDSTGAVAHSGVITLNWGSSDRPNNSDVTTGNVHGNLTVKPNALLKVVRKVDENSLQAATPLISYGGVGGNNGTNSLNVDHGSVVLEDALQKDSLQKSNLGYYSYLDVTDNYHSPVYPLGMVSMWGVGSTNRVNVVAPKLFKMVRTGKQKGMLFRLEATDNKITMDAADDQSVPVKYGTIANVKYNNDKVSQAKNYEWNVKNLKSVNWLGDYSMNYLNARKEGTPFGLSPDSSVSFAQATPQTAKDDFNNYFNWWSATNLEMGSDLNVFHPVYQPLAVMQNATQSENVLYQDKVQPSNVKYTLLDPTGEFSWAKVDATGTLTVAPTVTTDVGLYNVPVEVSFTSGQKVVAYAPVTVLNSDSKAVFNDRNVLLGEVKPVFTHKTSDKNVLPAPMQALNGLTVYTKDEKTGQYLPVTTYVPSKNGNFVDTQTGAELPGVKVTWAQAPTTVVAKDGDKTKTEPVMALVDVKNKQVSFPKAGFFPDLGKLPVLVTMYGASAKPDVHATRTLDQSLPQADAVLQMPDLTAQHEAEVASVVWSKKPALDQTTPKATGVVSVKFTDGTDLNVPVNVAVDPNMADLNTPLAQVVKTELNKLPEAKSGVANSADLPVDTQYGWKSPVDVTTPGTKQGTVVVTYPDGSQDELPVQVKVGTDADLYTPKGQQVKTEVGKTPDAKNGVSNSRSLPADTKYSWKNPVNVTTPGGKQGTVEVTYPDGTKDELPVQVKVGADADLYTPKGQQVKTEVGKTPEAKNGVSNSQELPVNTKYSWKNPVGVATPGEKQGTVVVTYPDGSQDELPVQVKVGADADLYTPKGQQVVTEVGKKPDAKSGVSNSRDLPVDTKYGWKSPVNVATPGEKQGTVEVTYPDGSQDELPVQVKVGADADLYTPKGQQVKTEVGKTPNAKNGVSNSQGLPADTKYSWKNPVNVTTLGEKQGTVVVTYPDGSKDELPVKVTVLAPASDKKPVKTVNDAEKYTPQSQAVTTELGKIPEAKSGVKNSDELPVDTQYSWKSPVDVTTPGEKQGTVVVTYPDGSQDELPVQVKVGTDADLYTPKAQQVKTEVGKTPEAKNGVSNSQDFPADTKYNWKKPVEVSTPGEKQGTVVVTYPDNSKDELPVKVTVLAPASDKKTVKMVTDAEKYTPQGQAVTTELGNVPEAKSGVKNSSELPADTKYSWKNPVEVSTPGEKQGTVVVTYPDGTKDELPVQVKVGTDADLYTPKAKQVKTEVGKTPEAKDGVSNSQALPADTKYSWKNPVEVSTPGEKQGTVVVTYPDGSQDELPVQVKVGTDADLYTPKAQQVKTEVGKTPEAKNGVSNSQELPVDTKYNWKNPVEVTTLGEKQDTVVVTYPDGSQDELPVKVTVLAPVSDKKPVKMMTDAEKYAPQSQAVTTKLGNVPEAKSGVKNSSELPEDTKYNWKNPVEVSTPGEKQGTVVVTYPDGSQDELPVQVKVGTDAELYTPKGQQVNTELNKEPAAKSGVSNSADLPVDTEYNWENPVEVSTPGEKQGTVVVMYPDGSKDELSVPVSVLVPTSDKKHVNELEKVVPDADKYEPQSQVVNTDLGKQPDAKAGVSNSTDLPAGTKYSWKTPVNVTTPGDQQGTVEVIYPDGSQDELPVTVKVGTDADLYTPKSQQVMTEAGKQPSAQSGVSNSQDLPVGTKYNWKSPVNVTTPGDQQGTVVVTYPDGSKEELSVPVTVLAPTPDKEPVEVVTDAEKYTPQSQTVTTELGKEPEAKSGVSNSADLPSDTKYSWKSPVEVTTPGAKQGTVEVMYPDGSKDELQVEVKVGTDADLYTPKGQQVKTELNKQPAAKDSVANSATLPAGTKYNWKTPVDVTTAGNKQGTVVVTYPDGSKDEVSVPVSVLAPVSDKENVVKTATDADKYQPRAQQVTTVLGKLPAAKSGVTNSGDLPAKTQYSWKTPVDVTTPNETNAPVVVTYPDGSKDELPVKVVVLNPVKKQVKATTDADKYAPRPQVVTTELGKVPAPQTGVANKDELPDKTDYSWKLPVDVTTVGTKYATVVVTYPDKSQAEVRVTVKVHAKTKTKQVTQQVLAVKDNARDHGSVGGTHKHLAKQALPQTGETNAGAYELLGAFITLLAGVLGLGEFVEKRSQK